MASHFNITFFSTAKVAVYNVAMATVIFLQVKISCFRAKAHLDFIGGYQKLIRGCSTPYEFLWLLITDLRRKEEILILRNGRLNFRKNIRSYEGLSCNPLIPK